MRQATLQNLIERFGADARCRAHFHGQKKPVQTTLGTLPHGQKVNKVTVLFDKPKSYLIDGDEALRDGASFQVV